MIVLTILKIIGIALLVILGILLVLICLALFVPVRYRAGGTYKDNIINASMSASWLLHIISAKIGYEGKGQPHIKVKFLFFTLFDNLAANKKEKTAKNKSKKGKNSVGYGEEIQAASIEENGSQPQKESSVNADTDINTAKASDDSIDINVSETKSDNSDTIIDIDGNGDAAGMDINSEQKQHKGNIIQKVRKILKKLIDFVQNIKYTFNKICDTIASIRSNAEYYLNLLQLDSTKAAFLKCRNELLRVFRMLAPKKFQTNLHLGFDNPATLGDIMAVWGMLYPFHQGRVNIQPEFEQTIIEGDFSFKGRISLFVFVRTALVIFFDKNIRGFYRQLKR